MDNTRDLRRSAEDLVDTIDQRDLAQAGIQLSLETKVWPGHTIVTYPFYDELKKQNDLREVLRNIQYHREDRVNLYVHVPYCTGICGYCAYSKSASANQETQRKYILAVLKELSTWNDLCHKDRMEAVSLYVGGGTPTALPLHLFQLLISGIGDRTGYLGSEATCECSPETVLGEEGQQKLLLLRSSGFNRVSIGVEAFSDEITRILRRRHGKGEAIRAVSALIQAGFQNVNVDLMYGLPKQKIEDWVESLTIAADLDVSSITLYPYRIKRGSIWAKLYRSRPDTFRWSPTLEMVLATVGRMYLESRGYRQSAVNWFLKDEACEFRHQDSKYRMQALLGVGCSAYSFFGGSQFFNIYREADYARAIAETDLALEVGRPLTDIEKMTRFFVFGIKGGLQAADFVETFRVSVEEALPSVETLIEKGLVRHSAGRWELTTIGKLFVDEIGLFMHKTTFRMRHVCRARAVQVAG